jgi:diacylglycerol kinase family enzyme
MAVVVVVINPVCGNSTGRSFFDEHVYPLLQAHSISVEHAIQTTSPADAPVFISQFYDHPITVILGSGDGTLHEIINNVSSAQPIHFVLVPCGTANALYSSFFLHQDGQDQIAYRLQSLLAFINKRDPLPLSLATTTFSSDSHSTLSAVVVSTSLHASILHHSESLRDRYPGIERRVFCFALPPQFF